MTIAVGLGHKTTKQNYRMVSKNYSDQPKTMHLPFVYWKLLKGTLANSEDTDEIQHNAASHQGLHCLPRLKQPSVTEIHYNSETSTCDPLNYKMDKPKLIVSICIGKYIRIQRTKWESID